MKIVCTFIILSMSVGSLQAQPMKIFGTEFVSGGNTSRILQITNPTLGSGQTETVAIDVAGFSQANGKITGAPNGTIISGSSLNAASYDPTTFKFYFRDNLGGGNLYSWTVGASTIAYVNSAANVMPGNAGTLLADNATIYKGGLW